MMNAMSGIRLAPLQGLNKPIVYAHRAMPYVNAFALSGQSWHQVYNINLNQHCMLILSSIRKYNCEYTLHSKKKSLFNSLSNFTIIKGLISVFNCIHLNNNLSEFHINKRSKALTIIHLTKHCPVRALAITWGKAP